MSAEAQSNEPGTAESTESAEQAVGLQALGELLKADEPGEKTSGDSNEGESSGSDEKTTPTKFNDLAGAADIDLDALYKLEVTLEGVDEPVTIEQLKDHYKGAHDFDLQVLEFEEQRTESINELVRAKAELTEILQALPANAVKPEVLEKIRTKAAETAETERAATLDVIPDWKDENARAADIALMSEHLQGYGFPVNQLELLIDHRWQRYIRDNMLRERRIKAALAKVRPGKPEKSGKAPPQTKAASKGQATVTPKAGQSKLEATLTSID